MQELLAFATVPAWFLKGSPSMDAFETSLGYRSLDPLSLLELQAKERFSDEELLRYARDLFDAHLAEALRSAGEWHWKLEIRELAEQVAETLKSEEKSNYEHLRSAILEHYEDQYRVPAPQEYRSYLRGKRELRRSILPCEAVHTPDNSTSHERQPHEEGTARFLVWNGERLSYSQSFDVYDSDGEEQIRAKELIAAHLIDEYEQLDLLGHVRWIIAFVAGSFSQGILCRPVGDMLQLMEILPEYLVAWQNRLALPNDGPNEEEAARAGYDTLLLALRVFCPEWVRVECEGK